MTAKPQPPKPQPQHGNKPPKNDKHEPEGKPR
jgi:hypothetical protein